MCPGAMVLSEFELEPELEVDSDETEDTNLLMRSHLASCSAVTSGSDGSTKQMLCGQHKHYHFIQMSADQGKNLSGKTVKIQDCMRYGSSMLVSLSFVG